MYYSLVDMELTTMIEIPKLMYQWVKDKPQKVIDHISPSALGGCMRSHYYQIKHVPYTTPPNPGAQLNFQVGFLWETIVEEALKHSGVEYKAQLELEDKELNVKGTLDFIIKVGDDEWEVLDIKTESVYSERYRKSQKLDYLQASERYVIQVGTYMLLLRRKGYNVNRARLVSIVKDNGMVKEYFVPYTQELEDKVLARINKLNQHLKDGTIPECECEGWMVGYCNYGDVDSLTENKKGKTVNSTCCSTKLIKEVK